MDWRTLGFKGDPLNIEPILRDTLDLYVGHEEERDLSLNVLAGPNTRLVIEGARGVGTTSFANFLRFSLEKQKLYFTPRNEIRVDHGWQLETLLAVIIANIVREMELFGENSFIKDKRFQNAKSLSSRIAETYRSFGVDAFGFGGSYGSDGRVSQPIIVPAASLGHHLEDLAILVQEKGYSNGLLIQLNNLDIGEVHDEVTLKRLFNALRDYTQIRGISWLFVGDVGLRKFIAQKVDRLDDIISFETVINPLGNEKLKTLIQKRVQFYRMDMAVNLPVDMDVFLYLNEITNGRLRYIFGLLTRLMSTLHIGDLTDKITLKIAKPMLIRLAKTRVERSEITQSEENILRMAVKMKNLSAASMGKELNQTRQYISRILTKLAQLGLISFRKRGTIKYIVPSLDAIIAYSVE